MIWNVFLDMVAMLIALLIICVVVGFTLWFVAAISRLAWRSSFVREMLGIGRRRRPDVELVGVTTTWCQGCDELVSDIRMTFTEGLYRCDVCRGIPSPKVTMVTTDGRPVSALEPGPGLTDRKRCDVCERSAPKWSTGTTSYRCSECRWPDVKRHRIVLDALTRGEPSTPKPITTWRDPGDDDWRNNW